jgi:Mg2+ and Co2+ transporter CorA
MTLRNLAEHMEPSDLNCKLGVRIAKLERSLFAVGDADLAWDDWLDGLSKVHAEVMALYERDDVDRALLDEHRAVLRSLLEMAVQLKAHREERSAVRPMTALTLILVVGALIAGIYGMNVALPAFDRVYGYLWALLMIVSACIGVYLLLHWRRWL